jgi:hypothetical protein
MCKVCTFVYRILTSVIEDEFHMLCVCPLYSELRVAYGIKYRDIVSSCSMLASQNENCVNNFAAFIYNAFKLRNTYLQVWLVFDCESKSLSFMMSILYALLCECICMYIWCSWTCWCFVLVLWACGLLYLK